LKPRGFWKSGGEICFETHLTPRSSRAEISKWDEAGRLRVKVTSPPVDGAANEDLRRFLAEKLGIPLRDVRIVRGETSRNKCIGVQGASIEHLEKILGRPHASGSSSTSPERS
jgi:uncharacterized protein (TIGR00251 family)